MLRFNHGQGPFSVNSPLSIYPYKKPRHSKAQPGRTASRFRLPCFVKFKSDLLKRVVPLASLVARALELKSKEIIHSRDIFAQSAIEALPLTQTARPVLFDMFGLARLASQFLARSDT